MYIFIISYILIVLLGILLKNHKTAYIAIISILLALISGLRTIYEGSDTPVYYSMFEQSKIYGTNIPLSRDIEMGYLWLQAVFSKYIPSFQVFLIFIAGFFMFSFGKIVRRYAPDPMWSYLFFILLFYPFYGFTGIRQAVAAAFCLLAIPYIEKKKFIPFLLLIMLATSMHTISVVFLPAYFLLRIKITKPYLIFSAFLIAVLYIFKGTFLQLFTVWFVSLTQDDHYETYGSVIFAIQSFAMYSFLLTGVVALFYKKTIKKHPNSALFYNSMILGSSLVITGMQRITMFYSIGTCLAIPYVMDAFEDKRFLRFAQKVLLIFIFLLFYRTIENANLGRYQFFWEF